MTKAYVLAPGEDWILDRFAEDWARDRPDMTASSPEDADVIWLLADFCWTRIPFSILAKKPVITSVHHIVPEKFGPAAREEFAARDVHTTVYHVPNRHTQEFVEKLTSKHVVVVPYWANQTRWYPTIGKDAARQKYGIPSDKYVIGSFQRDTEGHDLRSPKLEKGPDLLADYIVSESKKRDVHVALAGWRRQYVIGRLEAERIPFTYIERPSQPVLNELYRALDLYPVTARHEGGPQALLECGLLGVPVVSRPVGMAEFVLPPEAISDDVSGAAAAVPCVDGLTLPYGYAGYQRLIKWASRTKNA